MGAFGWPKISSSAVSICASVITVQEQTIIILYSLLPLSMVHLALAERQMRDSTDRRRRQDLADGPERRRKTLRTLDHLVDHRAAKQREGTSAKRRAGIVLARSDHGDGDAFVATEAFAARRKRLDAALRVPFDRANPAGQIAQRSLAIDWTQRIGVCRPCLLPAGDLTRLIAGEPAAKADADKVLRSTIQRRLPHRATRISKGLRPPRLIHGRPATS
jgi:hypothetical protein